MQWLSSDSRWLLGDSYPHLPLHCSCPPLSFCHQAGSLHFLPQWFSALAVADWPGNLINHTEAWASDSGMAVSSLVSRGSRLGVPNPSITKQPATETFLEWKPNHVTLLPETSHCLLLPSGQAPTLRDSPKTLLTLPDSPPSWSLPRHTLLWLGGHPKGLNGLGHVLPFPQVSAQLLSCPVVEKNLFWHLLNW